jgi:hypothetical protein
MWEPEIRSGFFYSRYDVDDERNSTGKWLVPVEFGDPDEIRERIQVATASRKFIAVKISSWRLDEILGHHLVCVYSERQPSRLPWRIERPNPGSRPPERSRALSPL